MKTVILALMGLIFAGSVVKNTSDTEFAPEIKSETKFPTGWQKWKITKSDEILPTDIEIPKDAPEVIKEVIKTYRWINDGKGSFYNVRFNQDDSISVMDLPDIKTLFITEYAKEGVRYGVFTYDGVDITKTHPSLDPKVCRSCHTGFDNACGDNEICSTSIDY